ncbi:SemiSWEET family transporter [Amniculibacterium aquaticum]|uniref:SemiSWEET family transporter n=1 Tax=Amniculibacterium aquaticum TaxID=2479858 RepID=UPI000F59D461|nr:SemiSWEET family transporter [Amniculibacterium aquaticum]
MTFAYIIGILTVLTSLAVKIIGYPSQILQIHKNKKVDNISLTLAITSFVTYVCWTIHGIIKNDVVVIAGQSLGILTSGILLFQILKYRNTNHKN